MFMKIWTLQDFGFMHRTPPPIHTKRKTETEKEKEESWVYFIVPLNQYWIQVWELNETTTKFSVILLICLLIYSNFYIIWLHVKNCIQFSQPLNLA